MVRIRCEKQKLRALTRRHMDAIQGYIELQGSAYQESLYTAVAGLTALPPPPYPDFASARGARDWSWLERLILADVPTLRSLTARDEPRLQFKHFSDMYSSCFSRSPDTYLYENYNAYSLIEGLGLHICPYCDEEPAETFRAGGKRRRNAQLDHFFPKGRYSGLAMCFFNLIPSGACNQAKLKGDLGANPYEPDIESHTRLFPDIALSANLASLTPEDCRIEFHATGGMVQNVELLGLEDRYRKHQDTAYQLLKRLQYYSKAKREELSRDFFDGDGDKLRQMLGLELPTQQEWGQKSLMKLKHDILITAAGPENQADGKEEL